MTIKEVLLNHEIDSLTDVAKVMNTSRQNLYNWSRSNPVFFRGVLLGASALLKEEAKKSKLTH